MDGSGNSKQFLQLLEHVKHCSENSGKDNVTNTFSAQTENSDRLYDLQRKAFAIQEILTRIPKPKSHINPSPQPHEIYQNLSPFMGSGFLSTPVLPPKGKIYSKIKRERAIIQFKLIYLILRLADLSFRFVVPGFDPHQEQLLKLRNH